MGILLFLLGLLALASGGVKLRARRRTHGGRSSLAMAELATGAITIVASGIGLARVRPLAWLMVAGVASLIVLAALAHVRTALRHQRRRDESEEARLKKYLG